MHRKGESKGLSATWWQVQESVRRRPRSGATALSAGRRGAAARARHESGLPEGGSSTVGDASAGVGLPGASTAAVPTWGAWFSCGEVGGTTRWRDDGEKKHRFQGGKKNPQYLRGDRSRGGSGAFPLGVARHAVTVVRLAVELPWRNPNGNTPVSAFQRSLLPADAAGLVYVLFFFTVLHVEGVGGQAQRGAAVLALEAAAVEELALRAQPLHHVHALPAEEAHVAAADVGGELLPEGALWDEDKQACFF